MGKKGQWRHPCTGFWRKACKFHAGKRRIGRKNFQLHKTGRWGTTKLYLGLSLSWNFVKINGRVSFHQLRFCAANAFICMIFYTASLQVLPRVFKTTPSNSSTEDDPHGSSRDSRHQFLQTILRFQAHLTTCNQFNLFLSNLHHPQYAR